MHFQLSEEMAGRSGRASDESIPAWSLRASPTGGKGEGSESFLALSLKLTAQGLACSRCSVKPFLLNAP